MLSDNIKSESEFYTFVKLERVIRRPLSLHHLHKDMADIIRSHKHEEERKSNLKGYMTNYFLHKQYPIVNEVCNKAIDIVRSIQVKDQKGILDKFFTGLTNEFHAFVITSIPYLIFLFPIGMFFSLKKYETKKKNYVSVWILFIGSTIPFIMAYSTLDASRMLFHLYPFLIIFSTLAIQQINDKKYKIFSMKKNNIFLTTIIIFMILSSILITFGIDGYGYGRPDAIKTNEIREYGKFLINDLDGKMFWSKGVDSDWIFVVLLEESNGDFKNYKINPYDTLRFKEIESYNSGNFYLLINDELYDNTLEKVILNGEQIGLRYISIGEQNTQSFFDDVYLNEDKYEYLTKIFDSKEQGFQKYKVKAFEIDYKKFHILYEKST